MWWEGKGVSFLKVAVTDGKRDRGGRRTRSPLQGQMELAAQAARRRGGLLPDDLPEVCQAALALAGPDLNYFPAITNVDSPDVICASPGTSGLRMISLART